MPTSPITLVAAGATYSVTKGHLVMLCRGPWVLDVELSADSLAQLPFPTGPCTVTFGGVPMVGTIDPGSSGTFGPTGQARVVAGGNGWHTYPPAADYHADNGLVSTQVFSATAVAVGELLTDLAPTTLGVDFIVSGNDPAMAVFGDDPWFVDVTGVTFHGPRPPAIPDPSLVLRDFDPVQQRVAFSCDTLLLPGTPLVDPRLNGTLLTVANVEQVFDSQGSTGWAWAQPPATPGEPLTQPSALIVDSLKAAVLYWTRATLLRVQRYRLVQYEGDGPVGGPSRMALQAVTPSAGVPDMLPIAPWSGVAGVVSQLAPSQEVLVSFEDGDPALPRVIGYSLIAPGGQPIGLPLSTTIDASVSLTVGPTAPTIAVGALAASIDMGPVPVPLVLAPPMVTAATALGVGATAGDTAYAAIGTFATALAAAAALPTYAAFATAAATASSALATAMATAAAAQATAAAAMTTAAAAIPSVVVKGT